MCRRTLSPLPEREQMKYNLPEKTTVKFPLSQHSAAATVAPGGGGAAAGAAQSCGMFNTGHSHSHSGAQVAPDMVKGGGVDTEAMLGGFVSSVHKDIT